MPYHYASIQNRRKDHRLVRRHGGRWSTVTTGGRSSTKRCRTVCHNCAAFVRAMPRSSTSKQSSTSFCRHGTADVKEAVGRFACGDRDPPLGTRRQAAGRPRSVFKGRQRPPIRVKGQRRRSRRAMIAGALWPRHLLGSGWSASGTKRNCLGARGISGTEGTPAAPSALRPHPPLPPNRSFSNNKGRERINKGLEGTVSSCLVEQSWGSWLFDPLAEANENYRRDRSHQSRSSPKASFRDQASCTESPLS